ncbi:MAG: recombinase family protein [Bacteroidetes bacterium]|nr:recombinase family protein [Bacteroidota bacterium]
MRDENNKPIIIPSESADSVRYAFEETVKGLTQTEIGIELLKQGKGIKKSMLSEILRNPVYMGKFHFLQRMEKLHI